MRWRLILDRLDRDGGGSKMTGGAYPPEIATRGDQSAYGKNRGQCTSAGEWLVGKGCFRKIESERRCMGKIGLRLELLPQDEIFSFSFGFGARSAGRFGWFTRAMVPGPKVVATS